MTTNEKLEIVKVLLSRIGQESLETDRAICRGVLTIIDGISVDEQMVIVDQQGEPKKNKVVVDTGKLKALRLGGWTIAKIAGELGVPDSIVCYYLRKEGIA